MRDNNRIIETVRSFVNKKLKIDVVKTSGHHTLKSHLASVFETYKIDTLIDVGANDGSYGTFARKIGFNGQIISFEPIPKIFDKLKARCASDPGWVCYNLALGSEKNRKEMNVASHSGFSSLLELTDFAKNRWRASVETHTETVAIERLEDVIIKDFPDFQQRRMLLKMDTQGYDLEVFSGAKKVMSCVYALVSEVSFVHAYKLMPNYHESLKVYEDFGFYVSGLYPVTRQKDLIIIEADCVMVRGHGERVDRAGSGNLNRPISEVPT